MGKKIFSALLSAMALLCSLTVLAADFKPGDIGIVNFGSMTVFRRPTINSKSVGIVSKNERVTILDAYTSGDGTADIFHKIRFGDDKEGYVYAYAGKKPTLITEEAAKKEWNKNKKPDPKYQHDIDMSILFDYIYGGRKAATGKKISYGYVKVPNEWTQHKRPASLPLVGKAVLHIGDVYKDGMIRAYFYPGNPPINYHAKRLDELRAIGYLPHGVEYSRTSGNANCAFYAWTTSEFDVVAYNDRWVAVWSDGGVDPSRGIGLPCGGMKYIPYGSWKPGVYFIPRKFCYILDINNQVTTAPATAAFGKSTGYLQVKTTPDKDDYVKAGCYKPNQTFPIVDASPVNGHYKIYYKHGIYYVEAQYVNYKASNIQKPTVAYTAKANGDAKILTSPDTNAAVVGYVTKDTIIDILQKDYNGSYARIWFNSKECYIESKYLYDLQVSPSAANVAGLGAPIGVMVIDSPARAYGEVAYSPEAFKIYKQNNYGETYKATDMLKQIQNIDNGMVRMNEYDWANVYKVQNVTYTPDPDYPDEIETAKLYTIFFAGDVRYVFKKDVEHKALNYYPGKGYSKTTVAKTQPIYIDTKKYNILAYNINGNNYFKLRDIAKMLSGTVKTFDVKYDKATNAIDMLSFYEYTPVGGELTAGDGVTRKAYSSSAFLTYDGVPVSASCYNINGNNYFKLRDVTDALDCRVIWDANNKLIKVATTVPAYDDPSEPVG